ncbi:DUF3368 domain-containing protein [Halobaculum sp. MBLA0147]|uniref:DUF3368 domain-containing protein n=1 Tax=Halobaculum sp. MBLA0147 TaxID=3079934 RepID=UPI003524635B
MTGDGRQLLVDASVVIRLTQVRELSLLEHIDGRACFPNSVVREVSDEPAATRLDSVLDETGWAETCERPPKSTLSTAAVHLYGDGVDDVDFDEPEADIELLACALQNEVKTVVVSDDMPLRETCKALSVSVTGSFGVLIRAVECGALEAEAARERLYAMDEVDARLSATLVRRVERQIEEAEPD